MRRSGVLLLSLIAVLLPLGLCAAGLLVVPAVTLRGATDSEPPPPFARTEPPGSMADLVGNITTITIRETDGYRPIELVRIGDDSYLILISGTQLDSDGGNDVESAGQEVTRETSPYMRRVRALIYRHIPRGSRLHFAGHSLGGMVANSLAIQPKFTGDYRIESVTTFGAPVNACPNPSVRYQRFLVEGDTLPMVHWMAVSSRLGGPLAVLASDCPDGIAYLEQRIVDHVTEPGGARHPHSSYPLSRDLASLPLPFEIGRYESMGRFSPTP